MTHSYVLIYEERFDAVKTMRKRDYLGAWFASGRNLVGESLGVNIIRGLGGFTRDSTPRDLIVQLEDAGLRSATEHESTIYREGEDVIRVVFSDGEIEVRWLTNNSDIERALKDTSS